MTTAEKEQIVITLIGDVPEASQPSLLDVYLADAQSSILNRMYPFGHASTVEVPAQYEMLQCKLAARYILRRGAEGEISHNENGINRTYDSVSDEDLLREVIQRIEIQN